LKKLFILKEKCGQSLSENVFNTIFRKLNIDYEYRQLYFPPEHLQTVVEKLRKDSDTIGFNVTIPYKTEIFKYIQNIDPQAQKCGAVNCVNSLGEIAGFFGYNTDWIGIKDSIVLSGVSRNEAIVLGAGGAARAAVLALEEIGFKEIFLANRTYRKAVEIKEIFPNITILEEKDVEDTVKRQSFSILINTTSVGMTENPVKEFSFNPEILKKIEYVFDIVYKPAKTHLLIHAANAGCRLIFGKEMLMRQAVENVKIWNLPKEKEIISLLTV